MGPGTYAIRSVVYAERTLMAGFTTVRDVGDRFNLSIPLRDAIKEGLVPGPRIFTAATSLASTGGHGDGTNGLRADLQGDPGPREGIVNTVEDAKKAVRQRYKDGADLIKITATGGVLSLAKNGQNPQFGEEEIRAIVETARDYGFIVAAHAHGAEGMKRAIRAGVTSIEHGTYMDEETIELFKQHGTYFVPTIMAGRFVAEKAALDGYFPDLVRPKAAAIGPLIQETFARAYKAGVKIAFGTDSGVSPHGENAKEFEYMVEAGMPPMEAIRSATVAPAEMLGIYEDLGSLEPGKLADIVAVVGDPLEDVRRLQDVSFVMKEGVVYKRDPSPAWPRQRPAEGLPTDRRLNVGFLVIDGVYNTELTAPYDIFQHTIFHTEPGMETFTVSPDGGKVRSFEGLEIEAHYSFADAPPIDVLVVPSAEHNMDSDLENEELIAWVRETGKKAFYVMSLCDGAFVLAKAGLLDGLAVTTFPGDQDRFAAMFPHLDLKRGVSFVHDGKALTSEGGAKSFDVAMYFTDLIYGEKVAKGVSGGLINRLATERRVHAGLGFFPQRGPSHRPRVGSGRTLR